MAFLINSKSRQLNLKYDSRYQNATGVWKFRGSFFLGGTTLSDNIIFHLFNYTIILLIFIKLINSIFEVSFYAIFNLISIINFTDNVAFIFNAEEASTF